MSPSPQDRFTKFEHHTIHPWPCDIKHVKVTDHPKHTDFYQAQLTRLKIVQVKITSPVHVENAEISSVAICLSRPYSVNWPTKVAHN